jgi:hypothetical protein
MASSPDSVSKSQDLKKKLLAEMKLASAEAPLLPNQCPRHSSVILYQCKVDNELLCTFCLLENHNGHAIDAISSKFDFSVCHEDFGKKLQEASEMLIDLEKLDSHLTSAQARIHGDLERISSEICAQKMDQLHAEIDKIRAQIQDTLSEAFKERMSFLCQKKFEVQGLIRNLTIGKEQLQQLYEKKQTIQSCVMFEELSRLMEQVEYMYPTYNGNMGSPLIVVSHIDLERIEASLSSHQPQVFARNPWRKPQRRRKVLNPKKELIKGTDVQVLWNNSNWFVGRIINSRDAEVEITYPGCPSKWDEWIPIDSYRLAFEDI